MKKIKDKFIATVTSTLFKGAVVMLVLLTVIGFAEKKQDDRVCKYVNINIEEEFDNYFIDQKDIMDLMTLNNREPLIGRSYEVLRLKELEKRVKNNKLVENAEVYRDIHGNLNVDVKQRRPIARLLTKLNGSWYISDQGKVFPTSDKFTARVPIIDGDYAYKLINAKFEKDTVQAKLLTMLQIVDKDEFLKALIAEVHIDIETKNDSTPEITLFPQVGNQIITYGGFDNPESKLKKIKVAYKDILPLKGWDTYKRISVAFKDQIICE
jgi:cell division protein FtsQ